MITDVKIGGVYINVETIYQCSKIKTKTKTLIVNGEFLLNQRTPIRYVCDRCGTTHEVNFRLRDKFFNDKVYCKKCNRENTFIEKYGSKSFFSSDEGKNKVKETKKKRYGDEYYTNREKAKETNLKRYGDENLFNVKEIKEKTKKTNLEKYGSEVVFQSKEIKEKIDKANIEKYGFKHPMQNKTISQNMGENLKNNKIETFISELFQEDLSVTPLFHKKDYIDSLTLYKWRCENCSTIFEANLAMGQRPRCPNCFPKFSGHSTPEKELVSWIASFGVTMEENNRTTISPKELDIYLPDYNLAIEFDGLFWHSDKFQNKNYHLEKTQACEKQGIKLIHIFEDEWMYKQDIVKARLKNVLGLNSNRIGARKTTIREIEPRTKNKFLEKYHIQGKDNCRIKLGAFYKDELIGVMTFSKPRLFMNKKIDGDVWELSRFATISNTYTPGLASKMLTYFKNNYNWQEIYSYADRRWSQGNLYESIGFEFEYDTVPNYWYFNAGRIRYHRYNFRKQNLKEWVNYSSDKTEKQIMDESGWCRIYDCGHKKYSIKMGQ